MVSIASRITACHCGPGQRWWIEPILTGITNDWVLMLGATGLTAFNDNAAITYLASQAPGLSDAAKYAVVAGAVTLMFFTYAFVNIGMVTGVLPVVGVPLPFLSYGGTALATLFTGIGILMSIHRHRKLVQT